MFFSVYESVKGFAEPRVGAAWTPAVHMAAASLGETVSRALMIGTTIIVVVFDDLLMPLISVDVIPNATQHLSYLMVCRRRV
jgi:hypothetical protein